MSRRITEKTLTDRQILNFARSKRDGTATDGIWRWHAAAALGLQSRQQTDTSRRKIAAVLEERRKK